MTYELWSTASRNLLAAFSTEAAALAEVAEAAQTEGLAYAAGFALLRVPRRGDARLVADGEALVERALKTTLPGQEARSASA